MAGIRKSLDDLSRRLRGEPPLTPGEFDVNRLPGLLGKDDPIILEIGCNDGEQTAQFLDLFTRAHLYAFEPDERARDRFRRRIDDARVELFDVAISNVDGELTFHMSGGAPNAAAAADLPRGWDLSGSIKKPTGHLDLHPWCTFDQRVTVRATRLDTWWRAHGAGTIDFIWADVQGAEADLIDGGRDALARTRYFYTEYNDRELYEGQINLRGILKRLPDFEVVDRFTTDVLLKNRKLAAFS